jgi:SAM-dependent methyltransferase
MYPQGLEMFSASAEFYDLIYSTFKDYPREATEIATLLRRLNPRCETILDVACGTAEHARLLAGHGFVVDGVDLDPVFVRLAKQKHPGGRFFEADMSDFHLARQYDAVLCLFSSIGYLQTLDRVARALACFREHVKPGGVIAIEPWFPPGVLDTTRVARHAGEANRVRVERASRIEVEGRFTASISTRDHRSQRTRHAHEGARTGSLHHRGMDADVSGRRARRRPRAEGSVRSRCVRGAGRGLMFASGVDERRESAEDRAT